MKPPHVSDGALGTVLVLQTFLPFIPPDMIFFFFNQKNIFGSQMKYST